MVKMHSSQKLTKGHSGPHSCSAGGDSGSAPMLTSCHLPSVCWWPELTLPVSLPQQTRSEKIHDKEAGSEAELGGTGLKRCGILSSSSTLWACPALGLSSPSSPMSQQSWENTGIRFFMEPRPPGRWEAWGNIPACNFLTV